MKGICINGEIYISRRTLEREIARLKRTVGIDDKYAPFSEKERNIAKLAWGDIVRFIHKEELADALADADTLSRYGEASWWEHREQELWAELLKLEESDG